MHFHGTTLATPEVVGSNDIHEVLTAYVLDMFSNYRLLSDESQVQFRFCLKLTVQGLVTVEQLGAICQQFDSQQESLFALEVNKIFKTDPEMTGSTLAKLVTQELQPFGMRVYVASTPPEFATKLNFAI